MTSELADWVDKRITASGIEDEVEPLILAAMEGDVALDAYMEAGTSSKRGRDDAIDTGVARGTFLTALEVEGFGGSGMSLF